MITPDLALLWYAKSREYPHGTIHIARKVLQEDLFQRAAPAINTLCGAHPYDLDIIEKVQTLEGLLKITTCKRCKGKFDGSISKQNSINASRKKGGGGNI